MNTGDVIQIEVPDFDPDIDKAPPIPVDQNTDHEETQGSANSTQQFPKMTTTTRTLAPSQLHDPGSCNCAVLYCTLYQ